MTDTSEALFMSLILDGFFYEKEGALYIKSKDGFEGLLDERLNCFLGQRVQFALHYSPPVPAVPEHWGLGCCHWYPSGICPVGHQTDPGKMLVFSASGILQDTPWRVGIKEIPLSDLPGHDARLILAKDFIPPDLNQVGVGEMLQLAENLGRMRQFLDGLLKNKEKN